MQKKIHTGIDTFERFQLHLPHLVLASSLGIAKDKEKEKRNSIQNMKRVG